MLVQNRNAEISEVLTQYHAARAGAVVIDRSTEGRLRALGRDRLDLVNRMSTNDLITLPPGEARPTVLTTPVARIVDVVWALNRGETALYVTSADRGAAVRKWLSSYIFYNDKVKFEDASGALGQLGVYGPRAGAVMEALGAGAAALAPNHFIEQDDVIFWRGRLLDGYTIIAPQARLAALQAQLVTAGAVPAGAETYQLLRLAAGEPEAGHELTEAYIPLEANLWGAVSFSKGCYIGQEIIARMESRGKLARRLSGLQLEAPVGEGAEIRAGETVIGTVTTAGVLPEAGAVALAFLKTAHAEVGTPVRVGATEGVVMALPFV